MQGPYVDCSKPFKKTTECHECGKKFKRGEPKHILKVYDDPFAVKPRIIAVHTGNDDGYGDCLDKLTDTSWADFRYQTCDECGRLIISQCPSNGWRSYFKTLREGQVCVKCYQDDALQNGHDAETFRRGQIPGDFFNSSDISGNGWSQVPGFDSFFIQGRDSVDSFRNKALALIKEGYKVLVDYGAMGIGGGEGYCTLYVKP